MSLDTDAKSASAGSSAPLTKVTLRGIKTQFGRFLLTLVAVAVGTAFLTGVLGLRAQLSDVAANNVGAISVYDAYVLGPEQTGTAGPDSHGPVEAELAGAVEAVTGTADVRPLWLATGLLYNEEGQLIPGTGIPTLITTTMDGNLGPTWVSGDAPQKAGQVAIEAASAERNNLQVGQQLEMAVSGQILPQTVVGIFQYQHPMSGPITVYLDHETATSLLGGSGQVPRIGFNIVEGADAATVLTQVQASLPEGLTVLDNAQYLQMLEQNANKMLGFLTTLLLVFAAVALFIATFIIANTFQIVVRARQREFALLRALGASARQIFLVVTTQAFLVGLAGGLLGVVLGRGLIRLVEGFLEKQGLVLGPEVTFTAPIIGVAVTVATLVTVASALLPARGAARVAPVEAMRVSEGADQPPLLPRAVFGTALGIVALGAMHLGATRMVAHPGLVLGFGTILLLVALLAIAPALVKPAAVTLGWPLSAAAPAAGRLAVRNLWRRPRRTAITAGALFIAVALVSSGAVLAASVKNSVSSVTEDQILSDLVVRSADTFSPIPAGAAEAVESAAGVKQVRGGIAAGMTSYVQPSGDLNAELTAFYEPDIVGRDIALPIVEGSPDTLAAGQVVVLQSFADGEGLTVGDEMVFRASTGQELTRKIGALMSVSVTGANLILPYVDIDLANQTLAFSDPAMLFVWLQPAADAETVKDQLQTELAPYRTLAVGDAADMAGELAGSVDQVMAILYALLGLSILVATIGIVNTLSLSVAERTRELGLLRAAGLSRAQTAFMVAAESVLTALFGAILGVTVGVGLAAALQRFLADSGVSTLTVPFGQLGWFLLGAVLLGVVAAIIPAVRASRVPVLTAITRA